MSSEVTKSAASFTPGPAFAHGYANPCGLQHGNVIGCVACGDAVSHRNIEMTAYGQDGISLTGFMIVEFQILIIGELCGNFRPVFFLHSFLQLKQQCFVRQMNGMEFIGRPFQYG